MLIAFPLLPAVKSQVRHVNEKRTCHFEHPCQRGSALRTRIFWDLAKKNFRFVHLAIFFVTLAHLVLFMRQNLFKILILLYDTIPVSISLHGLKHERKHCQSQTISCP